MTEMGYLKSYLCGICECNKAFLRSWCQTVIVTKLTPNQWPQGLLSHTAGEKCRLEVNRVNVDSLMSYEKEFLRVGGAPERENYQQVAHPRGFQKYYGGNWMETKNSLLELFLSASGTSQQKIHTPCACALSPIKELFIDSKKFICAVD